MQGACEADEPVGCKGVHNANNQLCGATYISSYMAGKVGKEALAPTEKVFQEEIDAGVSSNNFWSWLDAAFMSMNTWSRLAAATGEVKYFEKQWANFNAAMLLPANGDGGHKGTTFGFWNTTQHLFYRDDRYVHTVRPATRPAARATAPARPALLPMVSLMPPLLADPQRVLSSPRPPPPPPVSVQEIYWGRGNGWAIGALVAAIEFGGSTEVKDPHREKYVDIFKLQAAKLASIASPVRFLSIFTVVRPFCV